MDNVKNLSPIVRASVRAAEAPWLPGAEKFGFGTGLTKAAAIATRGGSPKPSGIAIGRTNFRLAGRSSPSVPLTASYTAQM